MYMGPWAKGLTGLLPPWRPHPLLNGFCSRSIRDIAVRRGPKGLAREIRGASPGFPQRSLHAPVTPQGSPGSFSQGKV